MVNFSHGLPQRGLQPFARVTVHLGKVDKQIFQGLLNTGSELTLILGDQKHHCGLLIIRGAYGSQILNGFLAQDHFRVGLVCT